MAKKVYVGVNNVAKNVKSIYVGVNGVARRVTKIYVGDANGKARLCYQYAQPVITYKWNRYALAINNDPSVVKYTIGTNNSSNIYDITFTRNTAHSPTNCNWYDAGSYGIDEVCEGIDSNGTIIFNDAPEDEDIQRNSPARTERTDCYFYYYPDNQYYYVSLTASDSGGYSYGNVYHMVKPSGSATAVTSTDPNAYPQNGQSGKYWYTYVGTV